MSSVLKDQISESARAPNVGFSFTDSQTIVQTNYDKYLNVIDSDAFTDKEIFGGFHILGTAGLFTAVTYEKVNGVQRTQTFPNLTFIPMRARKIVSVVGDLSITVYTGQ